MSKRDLIIAVVAVAAIALGLAATREWSRPSMSPEGPALSPRSG